jgi:nitrogen fixation protein FixH
VDGKALINLSSIEVGIFDVIAEFAGDENYEPSSNESAVNVVKVATQLTSPNKSFIVTSTSKVVTVVLKDVYGTPLENKTVSIAINGKIYNRTTDSNGKVSLKLSLTSAKTYKLNASFAGDESFTATSKLSTIKVTKQKTKLVVAKKTYKKSAKNKKLVATLKTSAGKAIAKKKVTFKVNGKTYKGTTNSKGKVTVKVKLTAKKTYKVTVKFAGDSKYLSVIKKSTVKIK